jgi:hypothetical protein
LVITLLPRFFAQSAPIPPHWKHINFPSLWVNGWLVAGKTLCSIGLLLSWKWMLNTNNFKKQSPRQNAHAQQNNFDTIWIKLCTATFDYQTIWRFCTTKAWGCMAFVCLYSTDADIILKLVVWFIRIKTRLSIFNWIFLKAYYSLALLCGSQPHECCRFLLLHR